MTTRSNIIQNDWRLAFSRYSEGLCQMEYVPPARKMKTMSDEAIVSTLKHTASQLTKQGNKAMGQSILDYVNKREEYKASHRGKYVLISDNGVNIVGEYPINTGFS